MPFVRCLVSLLVLLTFLARPVAAFASAGDKTDATCCCPDPGECKCHDHDAHNTGDTIKRCAGAEHLVLPVLADAMIATFEVASDILRVVRAVEHPGVPIPESLSSEPEKPPF